MNKAGILVLKAILPLEVPSLSHLHHSRKFVGIGRAVVFESIEDYKARVDDPNLEVDPSSVLVLKAVVKRNVPECRLETWVWLRS